MVQRIANFLGNDWTMAFQKGRDTATGQDVALLTRHAIDPDSVTTVPDVFGNAPGAFDVRPSKVLGVEVEIDDDDYLFVVAHFLSKRNPANAPRRHAQADPVRNAVLGIFSSVDHIVIMGDLNDTPRSDPLNRIQGFDESQPDFIQTGRGRWVESIFFIYFRRRPTTNRSHLA